MAYLGGDGVREVFFAESVTSRRVIGVGAVEVMAVREATLTFDLSAVESRYLRSIRVRIGRDIAEDLSRETAVALRDCLDAVLEVTKRDVLR